MPRIPEIRQPAERTAARAEAVQALEGRRKRAAPLDLLAGTRQVGPAMPARERGAPSIPTPERAVKEESPRATGVPAGPTRGAMGRLGRADRAASADRTAAEAARV